MIPWWVWMAIWGGLVLALLVMLGLFSWRLLRKFLVLTDEISDLAEASGVLEVDDSPLPQPAIAVLADLRDIRARENARRAHRANRRQERHDRRMSRARRITSVDAARHPWPTAWYGAKKR